MDVEKSQRVPPFNFFGIVRLFSKKIPRVQFFDVLQQWMFKKSQRGPPFQLALTFMTFWSFATEWMLKNPSGSPLQFFRHCETLFKNIFHQRVPNSPVLRHFEVLFAIFES